MAVPGFFMLSGFVLARNYAEAFVRPSPRDAFNFLAMRLARIYPVHFVTLISVLGMVLVSRRLAYRLTDSGYTIRDFILNIFLIHYWVPSFELNWNYPSWSISAEWFAYLLFPVLVWAITARLVTVTRAAVAVVFGTIATVIIYRGNLGVLPLLTVVPTFFLGTAIHALDLKISGTNRRAVRWWPEFFVAMIILACWLPSPWSSEVLIAATCALLFSLVHARDDAHRWWTLGPLLVLGEVSFSLYMTHTLAQKILYRVMPSGKFQSADIATRLAVILTYVALVSI